MTLIFFFLKQSRQYSSAILIASGMVPEETDKLTIFVITGNRLVYLNSSSLLRQMKDQECTT